MSQIKKKQNYVQKRQQVNQANKKAIIITASAVGLFIIVMAILLILNK